MNTVEELKELGFETAAKELSAKLTLKRKMSIAYENFRFVEPHIFDRFNADLKKKTEKITARHSWGNDSTYEQLVFTQLGLYKHVPPADVLQKLREAKGLGCFDRFEVAQIQEIQQLAPKPDPILFGIIEGCPDKFAVAQWDDDVKLEDILKETEG